MRLSDLATETGVPERRIRYFISRGLLLPPEGRTRGANYTIAHLNELKTLKTLLQANASLEDALRVMNELRRGQSPVARPGVEPKVEPKLASSTGAPRVLAPSKVDMTRRGSRAPAASSTTEAEKGKHITHGAPFDLRAGHRVSAIPVSDDKGQLFVLMPVAHGTDLSAIRKSGKLENFTVEDDFQEFLRKLYTTKS